LPRQRRAGEARSAQELRDALGDDESAAAPSRSAATTRLVALESVPQREQAGARRHAVALHERVAAPGAAERKSQPWSMPERSFDRPGGADAAPAAAPARARAQGRQQRRLGAHKGSSECASSGRATQSPEASCTGISGTRAGPPAGGPDAWAVTAPLRRGAGASGNGRRGAGGAKAAKRRKPRRPFRRKSAKQRRAHLWQLRPSCGVAIAALPAAAWGWAAREEEGAGKRVAETRAAAAAGREAGGRR